MSGYSARAGNATLAHDPPQVTVVVLESGNGKLAWFTAGLRSFVSTRVGEGAKRRCGSGYTIVSVSHTHAGPLMT
jgi:hypothetical protein